MFDAFKPPLYIRLSPMRLTVRNVKTGEFISEPPEIAISRGPKEKVLGAGDEAALHKSSKSAQVINPLAIRAPWCPTSPQASRCSKPL
jgi:rod shape-determining protein MreB